MTAEWNFDGHDLNVDGIYKTWALSGVDDIPGRRGANVIIPFADGTTYVEKFKNERTVVLATVIFGADYAAIQGNIDTLLSYFEIGIQGLLIHTRLDSVVLQGYAEVKTPINLAWSSSKPGFAKAAVTFTMSDPNWHTPPE